MDKNQTAGLTSNNQTFAFQGDAKFSAFQPIDVQPKFGLDWVLNGNNNSNFQIYKDAYDDSPTNSSIINAFVNYVYGEGLIDINGQELWKYISQEDALLICKDYKTYGGFALQVIWNKARTPLRLEYLPIYKLGVKYNVQTIKVEGYWYSYDWKNFYKFRPFLFPLFTGGYKGNDREILYVRRPTPEPFFPVPDYLSGIPWAKVEGRLANAGENHFKNSIGDITLINYNNGKQATTELARSEAAKVRSMVAGSENQGNVIVSFNDGVEESVVIDRISPPELNQQNVFFSEEAERKLIVAHSAPPILFAGSNQGSGFSSNADEIAVATKALYRRHINPMRGVILKGLMSVFELIDSSIKLDFKDFEEEDELEKSE